MRINKFGTDHKIADKWEQEPWGVISHKKDSPLLVVQNITMKEIKELHRNMLFPLRLVDPDDYQSSLTTPILIKAKYFDGKEIVCL